MLKPGDRFPQNRYKVLNREENGEKRFGNISMHERWSHHYKDRRIKKGIRFNHTSPYLLAQPESNSRKKQNPCKESTKFYQANTIHISVMIRSCGREEENGRCDVSDRT